VASVREEDDVTKIEHTLTIDRPVEEVWDFLMDARNDPVRMARRDFAGNFETLEDLLEARNDFRTDGP
jgi:hypothetical protein